MGRSCARLGSWYGVLHELKYCQGAVGLGSRETNDQSPHGGMLEVQACLLPVWLFDVENLQSCLPESKGRGVFALITYVMPMSMQ